MPEQSPKHFAASMPTTALAGLLAFAAVILGIYLFLTWQMSGSRSPLEILQGRGALSEEDKLQVLSELSANAPGERLSISEKEAILAGQSAAHTGPALSPEQKSQILDSLRQ